MNIGAACGWSLLRGLVIAVAVLPFAASLCGLLNAARGRTRRVVWFLLLSPFLVPELLVGYAYANLPMDWRIQSPVLNELFYSLLVAMRAIPIGVVTLYFAPPAALSREALHCRRLAFPPNTRPVWREMSLLLYSMQGRARALFPAAAVMFLIVFQEFELASRLEINSVPTTWTVKVYDAHVGGLPVAESLRLTLLPVCAELAIMLPVIFLVARSWNVAAASQRGTPAQSRLGRAIGWCYLALAVVLVCLVPLLYVIQNAADGLAVFASDLIKKRSIPFQGEILTSAAFAVISGVGAAWIASAVLKRMRTSDRPLASTFLTVLGSTPGLVGALVLSLTILALIQLPGLSFFYRNSLPIRLERVVTSLPLVVTLILWLAPRSLLLKLMLQAAAPREPVHAATLLAGAAETSTRRASRGLMWQMQWRGTFWTVVLLCYWAYWDLTAPSILMPIGLVAAPVRLYNFMHYSQSAMLSAMLCATMAFPLVVLVILRIAKRPALAWLQR